MPVEAEVEPAELLKPEDLLENAKYLLELEEPKARRAVVLESMTALEVYVYNKVFKILNIKYDSKFVKWLKEKTKMNFDDRLGYITPFALERNILQFRESDLWRRYTIARNLRNRVTHKGIEISFVEAEEVYKIVYDWLACLESSAGLELSLYEFREIIKRSEDTSMHDYLNLLTDFYLNSKAGFNLGSIAEIKHRVKMAPDYGLKFGNIIVSIDINFASGTLRDFNQLIETVIGQGRIKIESTNIDIAAYIIFKSGELPELFKFVRKFENGTIYIIVIKLEIDLGTP